MVTTLLFTGMMLQNGWLILLAIFLIFLNQIEWPYEEMERLRERNMEWFYVYNSW